MLRRCVVRLAAPPKFDFYDQSVEKYASQSPTHVTLRYVLDFSQSVNESSLLTFSRFWHRELPIRLSRTIRDFQILPYIVGVNPHIKAIYDEYFKTFHLMAEHPAPVDMDAHSSYCRLLLQRLEAHANVISDLSKGIKDIRTLPDSARIDYHYLDRFLDKMLLERISRRVLSELLLVLTKQVKTGKHDESRCGVFTMDLRVADVVENCMMQVLYLAEESYGKCPDFEIIGDTDTRLPCLASHLEYILIELAKNAVRATLEHHHKAEGAAIPKIVFRICQGDQVTIVISDQGGGISLSNDVVGSYGFSTSNPNVDNEYYSVHFGTHEEAPRRIQFAGFGFGLPLSRVYSQYSGGNLTYQTLPGYGTDMYLIIPPAGSDHLFRWESHHKCGRFEDLEAPMLDSTLSV